MVIGFVWYGPLFGKQWMALMKMDPKKMEAGKASMGKTYGLLFVGSLIMAFVVFHAYTFAHQFMGGTPLMDGLQTGFWNWLGFILPVTAGAVLFEQKPFKLFLLNTSYHLVTLLVMGVIVALWV